MSRLRSWKFRVRNEQKREWILRKWRRKEKRKRDEQKKNELWTTLFQLTFVSNDVRCEKDEELFLMLIKMYSENRRRDFEDSRRRSWCYHILKNVLNTRWRLDAQELKQRWSRWNQTESSYHDIVCVYDDLIYRCSKARLFMMSVASVSDRDYIMTDEH
jgi:hypothetical protein